MSAAAFATKSSISEPLSSISSNSFSKDDKIKVLPIFSYDPNLSFEMFIIELLPGCEHLSSPHREGVVEHIVVTEGVAEVLVAKKWRSLKKNEGLRFDASKPHGYRNVSKKKAVIHDMIHYNLSK